MCVSELQYYSNECKIFNFLVEGRGRWEGGGLNFIALLFKAKQAISSY